MDAVAATYCHSLCLLAAVQTQLLSSTTQILLKTECMNVNDNNNKITKLVLCN